MEVSSKAAKGPWPAHFSSLSDLSWIWWALNPILHKIDWVKFVNLVLQDFNNMKIVFTVFTKCFPYQSSMSTSRTFSIGQWPKIISVFLIFGFAVCVLGCSNMTTTERCFLSELSDGQKHKKNVLWPRKISYLSFQESKIGWNPVPNRIVNTIFQMQPKYFVPLLDIVEHWSEFFFFTIWKLNSNSSVSNVSGNSDEMISCSI